MQIKYFPKLTDGWGQIAGREIAYAALLPDGHDNTKKWPWKLSVHGIGERSGGTKEHLENLVLGQKQPDNTRKYPFISDDEKKAVDQYGIVIIVPTYDDKSFFDAVKSDWVYKQVVPQLSLTSKYWYDGFSYGGGAALNAITSSLTAPNIAYATPCSPTRSIGNISLIGQHKIPVHIFVNDQDDNGATNLNVTKSVITDINKTNPPIPAIYTAFRRGGHSGSHEAAMTLTPPNAPEGQGFINAAENTCEVFLDILANGPRQMKSGTVIIPVPIVTTPPMTALLPVLEHKLIGNTVYLDGSKSTGMKSAKLAAVAVPDGVNIYTASIEGGGSAVGKISLSAPGTYKFRLTIYPETSYKGAPAETEVIVNYLQAQPEPFKPTHTIVREDGTKEQVRIETL